MRRTMRPVTLGRVIETCYLAEQNSFLTADTLIHRLNVSKRRALEILRESARMNLLTDEGDILTISKNGKDFINAIRIRDLQTIHTIMMSYPFYAQFYEAIDHIGPVEQSELISYFSDSDTIMNQTTIAVLSDWGERIGSIQRNVINGRYYTVSEIKQPILPSLLTAYDILNLRGGLSHQQRYVEIPTLREMICEELSISRSHFDEKFIEIYKKNIGKLELSGAPGTTHAKNSKKKIKSITFQEIPDWITTKLSSEQYLSGIEVGNKMYYYLAIHRRDLND